MQPSHIIILRRTMHQINREATVRGTCTQTPGPTPGGHARFSRPDCRSRPVLPGSLRRSPAIPRVLYLSRIRPGEELQVNPLVKLLIPGGAKQPEKQDVGLRKK